MNFVICFVLLLFLTNIEEGCAGLCTEDPCLDVNKMSLSSMERRAPGCGYIDDPLCDAYINNGWYSMNIPMYNKCPGLNECGTVFPVWMNGTEPSESDGIVQREACLVGPSGCCHRTYNLKLKNCGAFVAYCLVHLGSCPERYCFGYEGECDRTSSTTSLTTAGELLTSGGNTTITTLITDTTYTTKASTTGKGKSDRTSTSTSVTTTGELFTSEGNTIKTMITGTTYTTTKASTTSKAEGRNVNIEDGSKRIATALYIAISIFVFVVLVVSVTCFLRHRNGWCCEHVSKVKQTDDFISTLNTKQVPEKNNYVEKQMVPRSQSLIYEEVQDDGVQGDKDIYFELNETKMVSAVNKAFRNTGDVEDNNQYNNDVIIANDFASNQYIEISETYKLDIEDKTESKETSAVTMIRNEKDKEFDFGLKRKCSIETKHPRFMKLTTPNKNSINDQLREQRDNLKPSMDIDSVYSEKRPNLVSKYMHLDKNFVKPNETTYTELRSFEENVTNEKVTEQNGNYRRDYKTEKHDDDLNYEKLRKQDVHSESVQYSKLEGNKGNLIYGHRKETSIVNDKCLTTDVSLHHNSLGIYEQLEVNNLQSKHPVYTELKK